MVTFITKQPDGSVDLSNENMQEALVIQPDELQSVIDTLQEILEEQE